MTTEPRELSDEAKAEIADAVRIIAEDKFYKRLMDSTPTPTREPEKAPDPPVDPIQNDPAVSPDADPTGPQSPPAKDTIPDPPIKKKAGLYWGEES